MNYTIKFKTKELMAIIEYSETMITDAKAGDWDKVFATEESRSNMLKELFSLPLTKQEKLENSKNINRILTLNKQLELITSRARENIKQQVGSVNKGRQVVGSYMQNTA